jgi:hypothetical protein
MSDMNNWKKIDNIYEEKTVNGIRYIREINDEPISLECPICKKLIYCIEDVEVMKSDNCCENCYITYYYTNKEKWKNGWRPDK